MRGLYNGRVPSLNGNWVDLVIIFFLVYRVLGSFGSGFFVVIAGFGSFLISLLVSLRFYKFTSVFLKANFNLPSSVSDALGFVVTAMLVEFFVDLLFNFILSKIPAKVLKNKLHRFFGIIPALGEGLVLLAFLLTAVVALPVAPWIKRDITQSKIGGYILNKTLAVERAINEVFGGAANDALVYLTVKPSGNESLKLESVVTELNIDEGAEIKMLTDLNRERANRGLNVLVLETERRDVARNYAMDMWKRKYFSHYSPEGESVGDRLTKAGIKYSAAGENLALTPTEETAHAGLMNSEGHRANILEPSFRRVGIGVIDNGIYGKIFVQVFTD